MIRWAEWSEFDLDDATWIIPAAKMKMRRDHVTPLSRQMLDALRDLHRMTGRGRYLFPGIGPKKPVISENTINLTLSKVGYRGKLVGHGSRHTAQHEAMDGMAEMLWRAQREGRFPDPNVYLNILRDKLGEAEQFNLQRLDEIQ